MKEYHPLPGFPADMPYFCLLVPTGGGKTWLAAKSVHLVNTHLLRGEHSVIVSALLTASGTIARKR